VDPVFTSVTISDEEHPATIDVSGTQSVVFKGTYDKMLFDSDNRHILLLGENNTLYWPQNGASIGACRAYFELNGISAGDITAARLFFGEQSGEETTTGIVSMEEGIVSMEEGRGKKEDVAGAWFSLDGVKLDGRPTRKGLYIHGGKKVVVP
jgi:hypothetical protein